MNAQIGNKWSWIFSVICLFANLQVVNAQNQELPSRLGIKGYFGFVVTEIDSSVKQSGIRVGDIILSTELSGEFIDVEKFQADIRNMNSRLPLRSICLKFNSKTEMFDEREVLLITRSSENSFGSKLGLKGIAGLAVTQVDPVTNQTDITIGDIIIDSELDGQITNILEFQKKVKSLENNKEIRAVKLKFVSGKVSFEDVKLKTYSYPKVVQSSSQTNSTDEEECPLGKCTWCCQSCPDSGQGNKFCATSKCETGNTGCRLTPWRTCTFIICV